MGAIAQMPTWARSPWRINSREDPDLAAKTIGLVKNLLHESTLTPARIDESDTHIVKCKERLGNIQQGRLAVLACEHHRPDASSTGR
jgi:hypothetical protein